MITQKTKISLSLLEYLEADDLKKLPNKAYVIGFIKSYAKALGIDEKKCLHYFHRTYNRVFPESLATPKPTRSRVRKKNILDPKNILIPFANINLLWVGGSLGGLFLFLFLAIYLTGTNESETPIVAQEEIIERAPVQQKPEVQEEIRPQTLSASTPLEAAKDSPIKSTTISEEKPAEVAEVVNPAIIKKDDQEFLEKLKSTVFRKLPKSSLYKVLDEDPNDDVYEYLPDSVKDATISGLQNIYIKAIHGDSWLTYRRDKGKTFQRHLKKGNSLVIQGKEIQLFMGNVNATKIFLNNLPLQIDSKTGVKSLIFPQNKKNKYHLPLFIFKNDGTVLPSDVAIKQLKALIATPI